MDWQAILYSIKIPDEKRRNRFKSAVIRRFKCDVWVTKDNSVIPLPFMKDTHLDNTWKYCAQAARNDYQQNSGHGFERRLDQVIVLKKEYERRGRTYNEKDFQQLSAMYDVVTRDYENWTDFGDHCGYLQWEID